MWYLSSYRSGQGGYEYRIGREHLTGHWRAMTSDDNLDYLMANHFNFSSSSVFGSSLPQGWSYSKDFIQVMPTNHDLRSFRYITGVKLKCSFA